MLNKVINYNDQELKKKVKLYFEITVIYFKSRLFNNNYLIMVEKLLQHKVLIILCHQYENYF
jgi:hypothetical protein